jgi:two-component system, sensor histidine kinase YesM
MNNISYLFRSIRGKILLSFFIFIIIPITTILYNFYMSSGDVVSNELQRTTQDALHQAAQSMDDVTERVLKASNLIINDPEFVEFLESDEDWQTSYQALRRFNSIQQKLTNVRDILLGSEAVIVVLDDRGFVHSTASGPNEQSKQAQLLNSIRGEGWFSSTKEQKGWPFWQYPYNGTIRQLAGGSEPYFALSRWIGSSQSEGSDLLFIGIPAASFLGGKEGLSTNGVSSFLLTDNDGHLLGGSSPLPPEETELLLHEYKAEEKGAQVRDYVVNSEPIPRLGWNVIQLVPQKQLWVELSGLRNKSILWLFGWFLLFTVVFIYFMIRFTHPLHHLARSMNRLGEGDFHSYVNVQGEDEIAVLGKNYNRMLGRLQQLISHLSEEQRRREEARFQALQAQINPHFLFNTLNSIKWMAMLSGAQHVSQMITKLGKLLQYTMKVEREVVSLDSELTHLEVYLDLQKIRFHDNVDIRWSVPPELRSCAILKFALQPIVENCIIHGQRTPLLIEISAAATEETLTVTVSDNGAGISEDKLRELRADLKQDHARYSGIGIHNVNERIKMHYGSDYGIEMNSNAQEGTVVTLKLPRLESGEPVPASFLAAEEGDRNP